MTQIQPMKLLHLDLNRENFPEEEMDLKVST